MKVRDVIKLIEEDGWYLVRTKGDHKQYKHPFKIGLVTIAGHLNDDIAKGDFKQYFEASWLEKRREKCISIP